MDRCEDSADPGKLSPHKEDKRSWQTVVFVFGLNLCLGINSTQFAVLYAYMTDYFDSIKAITGWIGSLQIGTTLICGVFMSPIVNVYGCRVVAAAGSLVYFIAMVLSSIMPNIWCLFITYGATAGISLGMVYLASAVVIQKMFNKNRTLATGITLVGLSVGNMTGPLITEYLVAHFGWRGALLIQSALLAHMIPATLLFPSLDVEQRSMRNSSNTSKSDKVNKAEWKSHKVAFVLDSCNLFLLKKPPFALFCISFMCFIFNHLGFFNHMIGRAITDGVSQSHGAFLVSSVAIGGLTTRIICSFMANLKCSNCVVIYTVGLLLGSMCSFGFTFTKEFYGMLIFTVIHGVHLGFSYTLVTVCAVHIVGTENVAGAQGFLNFSGGVSAFVTVPFIGWIYEVTRDYNVSFYTTGTVGLFGTVCGLLALLIQKQEKNIVTSIEIFTTENQKAVDSG